MASLKRFLKEKGYVKIPLTLTHTGHFEVTAVINGVEGHFILDTGASNTCVDFNSISHFKLAPETTEIKASGAGAREMDTQIAKKNRLKLGKWQKKKVAIVLFNMTHINEALKDHDAVPIDGIIGADILKKGKAVIDYDKKYLYIK
ncbi:retropepsin-like aspartic protease [Leptobacterium sp. I13]|uniref:retropepsin-like aspartic protease family protein n=1 Tax=Leptobacterium meishanense TaxID=3128904 RepID=UPI0030EDEAEA